MKFLARGPLVDPPPLPLALDSRVTVQLVSSGGDCIESVFDASTDAVVRNDLGEFPGSQLSAVPDPVVQAGRLYHLGSS